LNFAIQEVCRKKHKGVRSSRTLNIQTSGPPL